MCLSGVGGGQVPTSTANQLVEQQRQKNLQRPTKREATALELQRPEGQLQRQSLAGRLGVQQLRAPLLNSPR